MKGRMLCGHRLQIAHFPSAGPSLAAAYASRSLWPGGTIRSASSAPEQEPDPERQWQVARQRAWYLDDPPTRSADPARHPPNRSSTSPAARPGASTSAPPPHLPRFTTFDPLRTLPSPLTPSAPIRPLPPHTPDHLKALHAFLTRSDSAVAVIDPGSVVFLHAPSARSARAESEDLGVQGAGVGGRWDWVVVCVVKGRGKGVVGRAERAVRLWLRDNPILELSTSESPRRMPRIEADTDWSLVPVGSSRICINLFTQDGRDKWDLEDLYAAGQ